MSEQTAVPASNRDKTANRRIYESPEIIVYGKLQALAMGGGGNTLDDINNPGIGTHG